MPWTESTNTIFTNQSVEIKTQDALEIKGYEPFIALTDENASAARVQLQSADGHIAFFTRSAVLAGSPTIVFNTLDTPPGVLPPSAIEVHAQDGVQIVGYEPFLTLTDSNAGFSKTRIQSADGHIAFLTRGALLAGSPTIVFNTLDTPPGVLPPSAIEVHAQDGVQIVGYEPFLTLTDSNAGFSKTRIQSADGHIAFLTRGALLAGSPTIVFNTLDTPPGVLPPSAKCE